MIRLPRHLEVLYLKEKKKDGHITPEIRNALWYYGFQLKHFSVASLRTAVPWQSLGSCYKYLIEHLSLFNKIF